MSKSTKKPQPAEDELNSPAENAAATAAKDEAVATDEEPSAEELRAEIAAANEKIAELEAKLQDKTARAQAEVENTRKRAATESANARKFAIENFAKELLEVRDSLERAAAVELPKAAAEAAKQMFAGVELTLKQLDLAMGKFAVAEVEAAPKVQFDPKLHQAISTAAARDIAADHIVTVVQKGFTLHDRLLRPAMVVVAAAPPTEAEAAPSADENRETGENKP